MSTELAMPAPKEMKFSPSRQEIAAMKTKADELLPLDATDPEVYDRIKIVHREAVSARTSIDKHRLAITSEYREYVKYINSQGNEAIAMIEAIELPLKAKYKAVDDAKERAAREKVEAAEREAKRIEAERVAKIEAEAKALRDAEAARVKAEHEAERQRMAKERAEIEADRKAFQERQAYAAHEERMLQEGLAKRRKEEDAAFEDQRMKLSEISGIQQQVIIAQIGRLGVRTGGTIECIEETLAETEKWDIDETFFGPVMAEVAGKAKKQAISQIKALLDKAKSDKRLEDDKAAEAKRFKAEREAHEKGKAEAQAKIDAERRALEAEQAAIRHAKEMREAEERAAKEAVAKAERDRITAERIKREDEERAELERKRKAALAPDKEKITAWLLALQDCTAPQVKSKEAKEWVARTADAIATAVKPLMAFAEVK